MKNLPNVLTISRIVLLAPLLIMIYLPNDQLNLISIINYKNGLLNGSWNTFYNNGQLKNSAVYINGQKNGLEVWYYENGQKQSEVIYENNKMISKKLRWDAKGRPIIY